MNPHSCSGYLWREQCRILARLLLGKSFQGDLGMTFLTCVFCFFQLVWPCCHFADLSRKRVMNADTCVIPRQKHHDRFAFVFLPLCIGHQDPETCSTGEAQTGAILCWESLLAAENRKSHFRCWCQCSPHFRTNYFQVITRTRLFLDTPPVIGQCGWVQLRRNSMDAHSHALCRFCSVAWWVVN